MQKYRTDMSGSLLKLSSEWFMRPTHLQKPKEPLQPPPPHMTEMPHESRSYITPDEEFYIRKCCPITLSHLLPDLPFTHKSDLADSKTDFDVSMITKLEKHLDESHKVISCSDSTLNEEEDMEEEDTLEGCVENDININILHHAKMEFPNKQLLKPHKVNYPDVNMKELTLPALKLNNKNSTKKPLNSEVFSSSTFPRAKNLPKFPSERADYQRLEKQARDIMVPDKNNRQIQPLIRDKDFAYIQSRRHRKSISNPTVSKHFNQFGVSCTPSVPRIDIDPSLPFSKPYEDLPLHLANHYSSQTRNSATQLPRPSLCVHHRRARSLSPFKGASHKSRQAILPQCPDGLVLPSPHLIQLARLKKEELELEEKILLKQRRMLEMERLRPPAEKWYEMKTQRFHQEVHRNTTFLKNEKCLPLIRERRRQVCDALSVPEE